jgi:hypothetical protein
MENLSSKVEQLVRGALNQYGVEQIPGGYKIESDAATGSLLFLPATGGDDRYHLVSIAEISTRFNNLSSSEPDYEQIGRLNSQALYGMYLWDQNLLHVKARVAIYEEEPASEFVADQILRAFSFQMPISYSALLASKSDDEFRRQRAYQECPRSWVTMPDAKTFNLAASNLMSRGLVSTAGDNVVVAEVVLSGTASSRMIDPSAETALVRVTTGVPHPLAGVGYLATIALPIEAPAEESAVTCARLNALELAQDDFVPRLGAWGLRSAGREIVYSQFIPTDQPFRDLQLTIMSWMCSRVAWLRNTCWAPGTGLVLDPIQRGGR